ncbi:periplasmic divalent manganese/zinc-binding lipoprotein [Desulfomarina profundi]|uniref:Periplasmic divalent manganese/zinc-binding lipoprotein n=2 Tax=Desulfomarina profundi TaxID=2772557 RepID=A0A8D5FK82_9BACT|nr:periplasmic divalent manganese/zinc-binding lipoprotein [Desulfomarina profundi]
MLLFGSQPGEAAEKLHVVTSIFPLYDFTRQVGGERVEVKLLLPPGIEAHGFSPTPRDLVTVSQADLFFYTSRFLEPWAEAVVSAMGREQGRVVEVGREIIAQQVKNHKADRDHSGHGGIDPHIWLDPLNAVEMVNVISNILIKMDPDNGGFYRQNRKAYVEKLYEFDRETGKSLRNCRLKTIVSGGHFAFGPFAERYGLKAVSPFKGYSPNGQPSPRAIAALVDNIQNTGSRVIFHEELVQPKIARVIAEETGAKLLLLHGIHNVSRDELERGETWLSLMKKNVENLKQGLQCQ